jgi:serine/threonine protein kinase
LSDDIEHKAGSDTDPSFGSVESADPVLSEGSGPRPHTPGGEFGDSDEPAGSEDAPAKIVKICKKCMVSQSGDGGYCVSCGSELVPIRAVRDSYVGEVVGGKYKIADRLGAGGMGEVYLGVNEPLGQRVAVKFLSKKFTADESIIMRFLNEARSYCKVTHPNAVTLLEYGQHDDGALYLITEFIDGKSLSETLKEVGPFEIDQVVSISTQICEVLSAAHGQGVIHRDLKPDNIMLMPTSRGRYAVKVLDFGIAKIMDDDHANGAMTETGSVFGTPEFMSPEQACGDTADGRSDLYAAGIILFYLATGKLPFKGKNKLVVLHKQLHESPPRPSEAREDIDVPPALERVILKCLRKSPDQRFQTADELLGALEMIGAPGAFEDTARHGEISGLGPDATCDTADLLGDSVDAGIHDSITRHFGTVSEDAGGFFTDGPPFNEKELGDFSHQHEPGASDEFDDAAESESVDWAEEWSDREAATSYAPANRSRNIVAGLIIIALIAAGAVWALSASDTGKAESQGDSSGAVQKIDIDRVLNTGQVLGSLSAAQDSLRHGDFESARRAIEATYLWIDDSALPEKARERRESLRAKAARLIKLDGAFAAALDDGDCPRAKRVLRTMTGVEAGIEKARADELSRCEAEARETSSSPEPSPEPKPAENKVEEPEPEVEEPEPKPEEPKPEVEEPKVEGPEPDAEPPASAPPKVVKEPTPQKSETDGAPSEEAGFALPPKKLN